GGLLRLLFGLAGLFLEGRVGRGGGKPIEGRHHGHALAAGRVHAPLRVEAALRRHAALTNAQRLGLLGIGQRQQRGVRRRDREEPAEDDGRHDARHGVWPTTTRSNVGGSKYFAATRWTSAAVTRPIRVR